MKIIDVICGIGAPLKSYRFTKAEELLSWMDTFRIHSAVVYHSEANREPEMGNEMMARICARSQGRLKLCLALNPSLESLGIPGEGTPIARLKKLRPSAVRVFPEEQKFLFDTFYAEGILQVCQQLRLPVIVTQNYDEVFFSGLPRVCEQYPEVPIILPRFGMNKCQWAFPILKKLPNVYLDMSTMADVAVIEEITERFGSTNLLFGSGMPTYEPSGALGLLLYAGISQEDRENIAFRNFERLEGGIRYDD